MAKIVIVEVRDMYCGDQKTTNLQAMKDSAMEYIKRGIATTVHVHFYETPCRGHQHYEYAPESSNNGEVTS